MPTIRNPEYNKRFDELPDQYKQLMQIYKNTLGLDFTNPEQLQSTVQKLRQDAATSPISGTDTNNSANSIENLLNHLHNDTPLPTSIYDLPKYLQKGR